MRRLWRVLTRRHLLGGAALLALAACGRSSSSTLRILVPNAPGGGYDTTARVLAGVIGRERGMHPVEVFNLPGGSGIAGLARLRAERGNDSLLMMMGLGVVGAANAGRDPAGVSGVTPVARVFDEAELVLVSARSPLATVGDWRERWRRDPEGLRIGGGSRPGGPDHLTTFELADAMGVAARRVRYTSYDGGGPLLAALLQGEVDLVVTGVLESADQVRAGSVRALAVTGSERVPGLEVPTMREAGVDVVVENWRGLVAPPGLDYAARDRLVETVRTALRSAEWRAAARRNGWRESWLAGDDFATFLRAEDRRTAHLLTHTTG